MKTNEFTCEMIQDLIPLCSEDLCSADSKAAVEAHIQECENCRKLYSELPQEAAPQKTNIPDEAKVFRKIGHQMKKNRILSGILLVLLAALLGVTGYLGYGQIVKDYGRQSFETVSETLRFRKLAKQIGKGDFSELVRKISTDSFGDIWYVGGVSELMRADDAEQLLEERFQQEYGETKLRSVKVKTQYGMLSSVHAQSPTVTEAIFAFADGRYLTMDFVYGSDGGLLYTANETNEDGTYNYDQIRHVGEDGKLTDIPKNVLIEAMNYLCDPDVYAPRNWMEQLFVMDVNGEGNRRDRADSIALRFSETCREQIYANVLAFQDAGYRFTYCTLSTIQYDMEKKEFYWTMTLEAADENGSAVMMTRFTRDLTGLIPQDPALNTVYTDGCTEGLEDALMNFFAA